jgi:hypothetical protein
MKRFLKYVAATSTRLLYHLMEKYSLGVRRKTVNWDKDTRNTGKKCDCYMTIKIISTGVHL